MEWIEVMLDLVITLLALLRAAGVLYDLKKGRSTSSPA
jgi:hypothetical protein